MPQKNLSGLLKVVPIALISNSIYIVILFKYKRVYFNMKNIKNLLKKLAQGWSIAYRS